MLVANKPQASLVGGNRLSQFGLRLVLGDRELTGRGPGEQTVHVPTRARAQATAMHADGHILPLGLAVQAIPVGRRQGIGGHSTVLRGRPQNARFGRPGQFGDRIGGMHDPHEPVECRHHDDQLLVALLLPGRLLGIVHRPAQERDVCLAFEKRFPAGL